MKGFKLAASNWLCSGGVFRRFVVNREFSCSNWVRSVIFGLRDSRFLSSSAILSKDKPFVRELANFLEKDGDIEVWLDEREIAPGENIVGGIAEGLDSDFILLIPSPDSVDSNWVKEEWTDAFWDQTNNRKTKIRSTARRMAVFKKFWGSCDWRRKYGAFCAGSAARFCGSRFLTFSDSQIV